MRSLFHAHSGLRYLVLLAGFLLAAACVAGLASRKPAGKVIRILGSSYAGLLDLQVLLGLLLLGAGLYYPALIGHIVLMVLAAGAAHMGAVLGRRQPARVYLWPLAGAVLSLLLIAGGVMAIGRGLFESTTGR